MVKSLEKKSRFRKRMSFKKAYRLSIYTSPLSLPSMFNDFGRQETLTIGNNI
jgi:hypothetical protein